MSNQNKPKILMILSFPPPYHGSNVANETLWNSKIRSIFNCFLLDISDKRSIDNLGKLDIINVWIALKSLLKLSWILIKKKPDLVYLPVSQNNLAYFRDGLFILLSKFLSSAKVIIHLHGGYFKKFYQTTNWLMKRFIELTLRKVEAAIVLGNNLKYIFEDWISNIYIVPNGTNIMPSLNLKNKFEKNSDCVTITYLSNLKKSKGILDFLKSISKVVQIYPKINCKIAGMWGRDPGTGTTAEEIKKEVFEIIEKNGIQKYVDFLGVVRGIDKEKLLYETDIFVLPTYYLYEGQPISIIEAMAAGCPVISTPMGAIPETVIDGETGFIVKIGDPEMIADRIIKLIKDKKLREKMSIAARKRYEELYTIDKFIENMITVFKDVCKCLDN